MHRIQSFLRRAAVVVASAAAVVATAAVPAAAVSPYPGQRLYWADGYCYFASWIGTFYCDSEDFWTKPDGYPQVFVVGPDHNVYTRWSNREGTYEWLNMGGICRGNPGIATRWKRGDWGVTVNCKGGADNEWYHRERFDDGRWTPRWVKGFAHPY